jgi:predicted metalloprotease with PDZ domain
MKYSAWLLAGVLALGLALPAMAGEGHQCEQSAEQCLAYYGKEFPNRGWVGIELDQNEETGVMTVSNVIEKSPAMTAGFKKGDILFALNGVELGEENKEKLKAAKGDWVPGAMVTYTVKREGTSEDLKVTLGEMPRDVMAQMIGNHMLDSHMEVAVAAQ